MVVIAVGRWWRGSPSAGEMDLAIRNMEQRLKSTGYTPISMPIGRYTRFWIWAWLNLGERTYAPNFVCFRHKTKEFIQKGSNGG
jgi:hypothetical protein